MNVNDIRNMVAALAQFEKDIPSWDRTRSRILEALRDGEPGALHELQRLIDQRGEMLAALKSLELALKNSAASFARFEQKAAKDEKTLAEAKKKGGGSGFDDKHPVLVAQRQAIERVGQKLGFFGTEIGKLRDVLSNKYPKVRSMPELEKLATALRRDLQYFDESPIDDMIKRLGFMAREHRLRG
jgi:hypothetical protein